MSILAGDSREIDEVAKEWEHTLLQNSMDKELNELNRRLEEKEVIFIRIYIFYVFIPSIWQFWELCILTSLTSYIA